MMASEVEFWLPSTEASVRIHPCGHVVQLPEDTSRFWTWRCPVCEFACFEQAPVILSRVHAPTASLSWRGARRSSVITLIFDRDDEVNCPLCYLMSLISSPALKPFASECSDRMSHPSIANDSPDCRKPPMCRRNQPLLCSEDLDAIFARCESLHHVRVHARVSEMTFRDELGVDTNCMPV